jgi:hypothetical protein
MLAPFYGLRFCNYSAHPVHDHSPALDSGFRRNDASRRAISWFVMPTKVGIQVFLMIVLNSYKNHDSQELLQRIPRTQAEWICTTSSFT